MKNLKGLFVFLLSVFICMPLVGADGGGCDEVPKTAAQKDIDDLEQQQQALMKTTPAPKLTDSLERKNIARRLEQLNDPNKIRFIYLINSGKVISSHTLKGKVTSLNSYLTSMQQTLEVYRKTSDGKASLSSEIVTIEAPDNDGSFGHNVEGIFFWDINDAYHEWNGEYILSDTAIPNLTELPEKLEK